MCPQRASRAQQREACGFVCPTLSSKAYAPWQQVFELRGGIAEARGSRRLEGLDGQRASRRLSL